ASPASPAEPRRIARSTVSLGILAWRAARPASRRPGFAAGSGRPERAAVTSSRMILVKTLARFLSCAPFRYMMFLNCEWPAIDFYAASRRHSAGRLWGVGASNPIWQHWGISGRRRRRFGGAVVAPGTASASGQTRGEATADSHRLDRPRQAGAIVGRGQNTAQGSFALGRLRALARHLGHKAPYRRVLLHADNRIIVAAHPGVGLVGGAPR